MSFDPSTPPDHDDSPATREIRGKREWEETRQPSLPFADSQWEGLSAPAPAHQTPDAMSVPESEAPRPSVESPSASRLAYERTDDPGREDTDLAGWKEAIRADFETWLASVDDIPEPENQEPEAPDLYSLFEQLAIMNTETRRGNRRTAEAFSRWGDTLASFEADLRLLREQLARRAVEHAENSQLSRKHCLALVELLDRLRRLGEAFSSTPGKRWWSFGDAVWRKSWEAQRAAFEILVSHFEALLAQEGLTRIECLGKAFDPSTMAAVAVEPDSGQPDNIVIEELAAGYYRRDELLRPAQVKVTVNRSDTRKP